MPWLWNLRVTFGNLHLKLYLRLVTSSGGCVRCLGGRSCWLTRPVCRCQGVWRGSLTRPGHHSCQLISRATHVSTESYGTHGGRGNKTQVDKYLNLIFHFRSGSVQSMFWFLLICPPSWSPSMRMNELLVTIRPDSDVWRCTEDDNIAYISACWCIGIGVSHLRHWCHYKDMLIRHQSMVSRHEIGTKKVNQRSGWLA